MKNPCYPSRKHCYLSQRILFWIAFIAGFGLFTGGVLLGNLLNLAACPLCILQRMLYLLLGLSALLGLCVRHRVGRFFAATLMWLSTLTGAFIAAYQTYIQRFSHEVQCGGEAAWWEVFVDWAGLHAPLLFEANGLCSDPAWKLIGLSIAEWSFIGFLLLSTLSIYAIKQSNPRNP